MSTPIVLFTYNRPEHTRKTLESLMANDLADQSELFIYADGPKAGTSVGGLEKIKKTREVIREKQWCKEVHIIEREKNMGLANSVITGVTEVINKYGKTIVLEDDLILSNKFLKYMNDALDKFENEEKVMQVSGYMFSVKIETEADAFFLPFTTSWGWATWKRSWEFFDANIKGMEVLDNDGILRKKFNLNGAQNYYNMLKMQKAGKIDSWAIRFYLSVFMNNGLVLFPKKTFVKNTGFDGSGIHCKRSISQKSIEDSFVAESFPNCMVVDETVKKEIIYFFKKQNNFFKKVAGIIIEKFRKIC